MVAKFVLCPLFSRIQISRNFLAVFFVIVRQNVSIGHAQGLQTEDSRHLLLVHEIRVSEFLEPREVIKHRMIHAVRPARTDIGWRARRGAAGKRCNRNRCPDPRPGHRLWLARPVCGGRPQSLPQATASTEHPADPPSATPRKQFRPSGLGTALVTSRKNCFRLGTAEAPNFGPETATSMLKYAGALASSDSCCSAHSVEPISPSSSPSQLQKSWCASASNLDFNNSPTPWTASSIAAVPLFGSTAPYTHASR